MRKFLIGFTTLLLCSVALLLWLAHDLSAPKRRQVQEYHVSWLETPESHSIVVVHSVGANAKVPYLVITPSGTEPSTRGSLLRKQLRNREVRLLPFGEETQLMVLFHGRKGSKEDLLPVAERYAAVGYRCLLMDLPGHGISPIKRTCFGTDPENRAAILKVIETEQARSGFTLKPVLWGMSMGGSFVSQLVGAYPEDFAGAVIVNSFDRLQNVIHHKVGPMAEPLAWASKGVYGFDVTKADSVEMVKRSQVPVFVAHGEEDKLIPIELGRELFDAVPNTQKKWVALEGAHHTNVLVTDYPLYAETVAFLKSVAHN